MLCPVCGSYADDDAIVCSRCGKLLEKTFTDVEEEELMKFRQGRHLRKEQPPEAEEPFIRSGKSRSFEDPQPPVTPESTGAVYTQREALSSTGKYYGFDAEDVDEEEAQRYLSPTIMQEYTRRPRVKRHLSHKRMVNWAYVLISVGVLLVALLFAGLLGLTQTELGHVFLARMGDVEQEEGEQPTISWMGLEPSAAAIWQVGGEYFDVGAVDKAIEYFTIAREKNEAEKASPNVTGLLMLGEAYEAQGELEAASEVYTYLYTEVVPSAQEAYRAQVRVLQELGRDAEAAALLQLAYQKTGVANFRSQRLEILPAIPTVSVPAGYYTEKKSVALLQSQEHSVYYSLDPFAELPAQGIEYTEPLQLGEGEHQLRAVAVNGDLISDPLKVTYQIYMPTPLQPDSNLAPNTYTSPRKSVTLKPGKLSDEELEKNPGYAATLDDPVAQDITIYYTIDGSIPDADSPIYRGESIVMDTNGYMTLRAVSVNGYGKQGNMKVVEIKLDLRTKAKAVYNMEDTIGGLQIGSTTREAFVTQFGAELSKESVWIYGIDGECERYTYPWGYATFMKTKAGWMLAEVYLTNNDLKAPRGTGIGMTENEIVALFRDYKQVTSPSGNRGLYEDGKDKGKIYVQEDGGKIIRYRTGTEDAHIWQLDYILDAAGKCTAIHWLYER